MFEGFEHKTLTFSPIAIVVSVGVTDRSSLGSSGLLSLISHPVIRESLHLGHLPTYEKKMENHKKT